MLPVKMEGTPIRFGTDEMVRWTPLPSLMPAVWFGPVTIDIERGMTLVNGCWVEDRKLKEKPCADFARQALRQAGIKVIDYPRSTAYRRSVDRQAGRELAERIMRKAHQRATKS